MDAPVHSKQDVLQKLEEHKQALKALGVSSLGLFGSFANGTNIHKQSDVDLLVEFESGKKTYDNFFELSEYLQTLFNRKVELVTPQALSKHIGPHILKQVVHVGL